MICAGSPSAEGDFFTPQSVKLDINNLIINFLNLQREKNALERLT